MAKLEGKAKNLICYKCHADCYQDRDELSQKGGFLEMLESLKLLGKVLQITVGINAMELGVL